FHTVKISADGAYVAALWQEKVVVWDTRSGEKLTTLSGEYSNLAFAGKDEVVLSRNRMLEIRDARDLRNVRASLPCNEGYLSIDVSEDGSRLAAGSWKGEVEIWDLASGKLSRRLKVDLEKRKVGVFLSPDGRWLMTSAEGPRNAIWDMETGRRVANV